jgi:hypothetical protein
METDETERTEAVVNPDRGIGYVFVLGGERMEMDDPGRLRQKQYRRSETGYPAHPGSAICSCQLHQVFARSGAVRQAETNLSAFIVPVKFSLLSDTQTVRK